MIITNAHVFIDGAFHEVDVEYDENQIVTIGKGLAGTVCKDQVIDAEGNYLFAGFIETHQHGGFRKTFYRNEYSENGEHFNGVEDVNYILERLPRYGVTTVFPTLDVQPVEDSVEALRAIRVEYEELPFVLDPRKAMEPGAPQIHEACPGNVLKHTQIRRGDYAAAIQEPGLICVDKWYETPTVQHCHIENHGCYAYQ